MLNYALLGQRISEERKKRKMTQEQLAEEANLTASFVGFLERGAKKPSVESLVSIANVLKIGIDYLLMQQKEIPHPVLEHGIAEALEGVNEKQKEALTLYIISLKEEK